MLKYLTKGLSRLLVLSLFFVTCNILGAQSTAPSAKMITWSSFNSIEIEGQIRDFKTSGSTFELVPIAFDEYEKALSEANTASILGLSSLIAIPVGLFIISADSDPRASSASVIGGMLTFVGTPILGLAAIGTKGSAKKHQKNAVRLYNGLYEKYKADDSMMAVSISTTANGIGLVLTF